MNTRLPLSLLVGLGALIAVLIGCGAAPASQSAENAPVTQMSKFDVATQEPQTAPSLPQAADAPIEEEAAAVKVGYKVGMHVPDFGMSLMDKGKVTSETLVAEGKPVFIYFHATW